MKIFVIALTLLTFCLSSASDKKPILRWGGDAIGGAPYVFNDQFKPEQIVGFEVDIANLLAREMGMEPQFVQNQWDSLIPGLNRDSYDVVINGIEVTQDRASEVEFSEPYYMGYESLTVRKENFDTLKLNDLEHKKAGTLKGALAERMLQANPKIEVLGYDNQTTLYDDLANGRLDAVLLDQPAALYYAGMDRRLKSIPDQFGEFSYAVAIKKGRIDLLAKVNAALRKIIASGELREVYERWKIWNPMMAHLYKDNSVSTVEPTAYNDYVRATLQQRGWKEKVSQYASYIPLLAHGAVMTLELSILAMAFAILGGLLIALMRLYGPKPLQWFAIAYTEFIRGTPLLIQLFFIYYGLPNIGLNIAPFTAAILGLAMNYSAYEAEVYRAGIRSIPHSQMEAALALDLTRWQALRHIILPQAMRMVLPPMTNDFISLLKDSSLVSVITMVELTRVYGQLAATYYDYFGIGVMAAIAYFLIGLPFVRLSRWAESHFGFDRQNLASKIKAQGVQTELSTVANDA